MSHVFWCSYQVSVWTGASTVTYYCICVGSWGDVAALKRGKNINICKCDNKAAVAFYTKGNSATNSVDCNLCFSSKSNKHTSVLSSFYCIACASQKRAVVSKYNLQIVVATSFCWVKKWNEEVKEIRALKSTVCWQVFFSPLLQM